MIVLEEFVIDFCSVDTFSFIVIRWSLWSGGRATWTAAWIGKRIFFLSATLKLMDFRLLSKK